MLKETCRSFDALPAVRWLPGRSASSRRRLAVAGVMLAVLAPWINVPVATAASPCAKQVLSDWYADGRAGRRQLPTQLLRRGARRRTLRHPRLHGCSRCDCSRAPGGGPPVRCHHSAQYAKATERDPASQAAGRAGREHGSLFVDTGATGRPRVLGARPARFGRAWARHAPPPRRRDRTLGRRRSVARRRVRGPHALHLVGGCGTP